MQTSPLCLVTNFRIHAPKSAVDHELTHPRFDIACVAEFLVQMQGVGHGNDERVLVLAATNIPWNLDAGTTPSCGRALYTHLEEWVLGQGQL